MLLDWRLEEVDRQEAHATDGRTRDSAAASAVSLRRTLRTMDALAITVATLVGYLASGGAAYGVIAVIQLTLVVVASTMLVMLALKLDRSRISSARGRELRRLSLAAAAAGVVAGAIAPQPPGRTLAIVALPVFAALGLSRSLFASWLRMARLGGRFRRRVLVVGSAGESERLLELIEHHPELGYDSCGVVDPGDAVAAVRRTKASGVLVAASGLASSELNPLIRRLHDAGIHVQLWTGMIGIGGQRVRIVPFAHEPMLYLEPGTTRDWQQVVKRAFDVVGAAAVLTVTSPLWLAAAIAIKIEDRGPILFRQTRVGRYGSHFTVLKLRTMVTDAEARLAELSAMNERGGPLFKATSDPRTTRVGRFLRESSIDELPQLWNVLRGDMSIVGPRPALPAEVEQFDDDRKARHQVRPGVTGLWQIEARDNPSFFAYRHLDLYYVENATVGLDLVIALSTFWSILGRGVRVGLSMVRPGGGVDRGVAPPPGLQVDAA